MNLVEFCPDQKVFRTFHIFDDFEKAQNDRDWIDTATDSGSATVGDAASGIMALVPSDGTVADNDETYLEGANECFLVAAGRTLYAMASIQFTEANTDDANIAFGFMSAPGANSIVDDGAGLQTTGNWFAIYKVDGETVWRVNCRNSTATGAGSALGTKTLTTAGGATYQTLEIFIIPLDSTNVEVTYKVDGLYLRNADANSADDIIRHKLAIASSTEMKLFFGVKNGAGNLETLNVDYVFASQSR